MHLHTVLLHTGGSYPQGWLHSDWRPEPTVVVGVFALIAAYIWRTGPKNRDAAGNRVHPVSTGQRVAFVLGCLVLLIALNPPLDDWADSYLLSAHMLQHMLLMFVVAPLWLGGTPAWLLGYLVARARLERVGYALTRPVPALVISSAVVSIWHMPFAYDAALRHEPIHVAQHLSFLAAALLSFWPVMGTLPAWPRMSAPLNCLYLFLLSIPGGIVGALITLAAPGLYAGYDGAPRIFGIGAGTDQEIAGLMMWVLGSSLYLLGITVLFFNWAGREEEKERRGTRPSVAPSSPEPAPRLDSASSGLPG